MAKYGTKVDILLAKSESLYQTIVSQKVSMELGLAIKNKLPFDKLTRENQLTIAKIVVEWEKSAKTIDAEAAAEGAQAELKADEQPQAPTTEDSAK